MREQAELLLEQLSRPGTAATAACSTGFHQGVVGIVAAA